MGTMKAALHDGVDAMHSAEIEKPAVGPRDAMVKVRSAGICGSDLLNYPQATKPETLPGGHEVAGEIVEVGADVDAGRVGQRVAVETIGHGRACLECWFCRIGQYRTCRNSAADRGGGYAQYIVRLAAGCYQLPDGLSWEEAALVEPLAVSVHAVRRAPISGGETVAVLGAGNIGLTAVAAARALGAGAVLVSARHEHQADMARRLGADHALPPGPDFEDAVRDATDGRGADMTIETVGGHSEATIKQAIEVTRMQGKIVVLGGFHRPLTLDWLEPLLKEQSIIFSSCYSVIDGRHDFQVAIDLMASGRAQLRQMVTHKFALDDIQEAFATASDKSTGSIKVQIRQ